MAGRAVVARRAPHHRPAARMMLRPPHQVWIDPAMELSRFLKPALAGFFFVALGVGDYWWEHRPEPEEKDTAGEAVVVVTKTTNACFSDQIRATGLIVPRREAVVGADQE